MDTDAAEKLNPVVEPKREPPSKPRFPLTLMLLVLVLVVFVTVLVTLALPQSFAAMARLRIERDQADIPSLAESGAELAYDPHFIQTELEVMQSEIVLGPIVRDLNLNQEWGRRYGDGNPLKTSESLTMLKDRLTLRSVSGTSLVEIRAVDDRPEAAGKLANAVAEAYRDHRQQARVERISGSVRELEGAYAENDAKIRALRAEIATLSHAPSDASAGQLEDAKRKLDDLTRVDQMLSTKIAAEKADIRLPATRMVEIVDLARPAFRAVKPDPQLNILVSVGVGAVAGLVLATIIYWLRLRVFWRTTNTPRPQAPLRVRAIVHFTVALVVGVIIGYFCATPFALETIIVVPVALILGGLASAWIELADGTPPRPRQGGKPALFGSQV